MSNESSPKCPQCGASLPENAPAGLCPQLPHGAEPEDGNRFHRRHPPPRNRRCRPNKSPRIFRSLKSSNVSAAAAWAWSIRRGRKALNRLVALKLLAPERVRDAKFAERFTREAQALAALNHPNIVTIHDFGQAGGFYFLLMEFVDGVNLAPAFARAEVHAGRGAGHRAAAVRRAAIRPRPGHRPPRHQAGEPAARQSRPGEGRRFWHRQNAGRGARLPAAAATAKTPPKTQPSPFSGSAAADSRAHRRADCRHARVTARPNRRPIRSAWTAAPTFIHSAWSSTKCSPANCPANVIEPPSRKVQIDVRLDEVVLRALEQKPELRYQQVSEVKTMVENILTMPTKQPSTPKTDKHMTEFKFFCPQCSQQIKCDTGYSGTQINCPACKQAIAVPQAPGSAAQPPVPAKLRALRNVLVITASAVVLAGLVTAGWFGYSKYKLGHLPPGLVAHWSCEGSGNDSAGKNNATVPRGVTYAAAGRGFKLNSQNQQDDTPRIVVPDAPDLNFGANQDFTITAWIQPLSNPGNYTDLSGEVMTVISKRFSPNAYTALGYEMYLGGGRLCFQMIDSLNHGGNYYNLSAESDLRDGKFHHVAVTVQRNSTTGLRFYVDGQLIATFDPTVVSGDLSNTGPLRIGNHPDPGLRAFYHGIIDEVSLYNRALSASEIQAIYTKHE